MNDNGRWGACSRCHTPLHQVTIVNALHPDYGRSFATCQTHGHAFQILFQPGDEVVFTENTPNQDWLGTEVRLLSMITDHRDRPYHWWMEITHLGEGLVHLYSDTSRVGDPLHVGEHTPGPIGSNVMVPAYWVAHKVPEFTSTEDADRWLDR